MSTVFHDFVPLSNRLAPLASPTTSSAVDVLVIPVPYKCQVRRVAVVPTQTSAGTSDYAFDQRVTAGSNTSRVTFATVSKAGNQQGKYIYEDPASSVVLNEGDEVVVKSTALAVAPGKAHAIVLVERIPETAANQADMVAG